MLIRLFLSLFLLWSLSLAKEEYPLTFSQLGTPLYTSLEPFSNYIEVEMLTQEIVLYESMVNRALKDGYKVDKSIDKKEKKAYLKELRNLQKEYDKLLFLLHKSIDESIKKDDFKLFIKLTSYAFDGLFQNTNSRNRAIEFYSIHKHKAICPVLDKQMSNAKLSKETEELFKAEVINSSYDSRSTKKSTKKVVISALRVKNRIYVKLINKNIYPVTIKVTAEYKNLKPSPNTPKELVLAANSTVDYTTLKIGNGKSYYSYRYSWTMGSKDAKHEDNYIYRLPYKRGTTHRVSQGYNGARTHKGRSAYSIDFPMPEGTKIYAARDGLVVKTKSNSNIGGYDKKFASSGNYVRILHDDGTLATYYHLKQRGVLVNVGQRVSRGLAIGYSGNTGYSSGPHLHFSVFKAISASQTQTIPVKISSKEGLIEGPEIGNYYTSF